MPKYLFSKLVSLTGFLCFLPTTRADSSIVETLVKGPFYSQRINVADGKVSHDNVIRHVDFSEIVLVCLVNARLKAGLNEFGHYHSKAVNSLTWALGIVNYIREGIFYILSDPIDRMVDRELRKTEHKKNPKDQKAKSAEEDITKFPFNFLSCVLLPIFCTILIPPLFFIWTLLLFFIALLMFCIFFCITKLIKFSAIRKSEQEFKLLLRQAFIEICQIASKQGVDLKVLAKDALMQTEMDKFFGNNFSFGQRLELSQSRLGKNYELISGHWENLANEARKQLELARVA